MTAGVECLRGISQIWSSRALSACVALTRASSSPPEDLNGFCERWLCASTARGAPVSRRGADRRPAADVGVNDSDGDRKPAAG